MHLSTQDKKDIFTKFGGSETNTGSTEAQIAMFTENNSNILCAFAPLR